MRILYASERPPYPYFLGGAARCAHQLLMTMANELGVECAAVGSSDYAISPWADPQPGEYQALGIQGVWPNEKRRALSVSAPLRSSPRPVCDELEARARPDEWGGIIDCGYPVQVFPNFLVALADFIDDFKPDVIWSQLEGAREVLDLAKAKGIQGVLYVHDAEFDPDELRATAELGCHVVCSSGFLAEKVRRVLSRGVHVVYPAAELYFDSAGDPDGYVTMINPHRVKGVDTFFEIARRLPAEKFLLLESWKLNDAALASLQSQLNQVPNVLFVRRVSDMRSIYRQTKLLVIPSIWEEGFGLVAIEAQSCCIPVIASARGGLPESVGDGGILIQNSLNADAWVEAIGEVLGDAFAYSEWSRRALRHAGAEDFAPLQLARRFLEVCSAPVLIIAWHVRVLNAARDRLQKLPVLGRLFCRDFR
ncbi:hypothetical protein SCD_n02982 [Sulfuricella denitrificans skB26]|uniref:Glycosyl transferase family 1 domain-containing protein n=1 Tax=Sulfuricella denitrificans (strain DSM 22764 / NBRC 105220 / skB26) TaxID=1163617 RepID=S6AK83_SULDS|nr:glycosyltransferase [Sulfuricella denitrificans]BAN36781.1 hypothetical protein SCD_n02982 [Sulfuricella denitrificans skB26]